MANFQLFFSVHVTGGIPAGPDLENREGDQDTGSPGRSVSSELQVPGELGIVEQDTLGDIPAAFSSKRHSIAPAEISNTPR